MSVTTIAVDSVERLDPPNFWQTSVTTIESTLDNNRDSSVAQSMLFLGVAEFIEKALEFGHPTIHIFLTTTRHALHLFQRKWVTRIGKRQH